VTFNNTNNTNVQVYNVNYNIKFKPCVNTYQSVEGVNEYDIYNKISKEYSIQERLYLKGTNVENESSLNVTDRCILVAIKNIYNYNIKLNSNNNSYTRSSSPVTLDVIPFDGGKIEFKNFDFVSKNKDINEEYISFISSPSYLIERFLYGKERKKNDYLNYSNNKLIIYKLV
jgi:hypothetical protein